MASTIAEFVDAWLTAEGITDPDIIADVTAVWEAENLSVSNMVLQTSELVASIKDRLFYGPEATLASAATVNLASAGSRLVKITGTTTVVSLGSGPDSEVPVYKVRFAGALTLTHGANLQVIGAANLTTAANDTAEFIYEGSGVWRMIAYFRAAGGLIAPTFGANFVLTGSNSFGSALTNTAQFYRSATLGLVMAGAGSTSDIYLSNKAGQAVLQVPTGTTNVGLGTGSADTKLQVISNSLSDGIEVATASGGARKRAMLAIDGNLGILDAYHIGTGVLPLSINPNGGSVGIGTTTPVRQLTIGNPSHAIMRLDAGAGAASSIEFTRSGSAVYELYMPAGSDALRLYNGGDKFSFTAGGLLGIGTTAPRGPLDFSSSRRPVIFFGTGSVIGEMPGSAATIIGNDIKSEAIDEFTKTSADAGSAISLDYSNGFRVFTGIPGAVNATGALSDYTRMVVKPDGKVGIGTTTPDTILKVAAADPRFRIRNTASSNKEWDLYLSGPDLLVQEVGVDNSMTFHAGGGISMNRLPTHADNLAASGAGLGVGRLYKTSAGDLRIVVL